jgi:glycine/D-amino acid oxidase-like deaminating enzyme
MHVNFLIIGQGISGSFLSYELEKRNASFSILNHPQPNAASKVASGIINPVTGRRIVKTWMIDDLLPFVKHAYTALGEALRIDCFTQKNIIDFFPTPQMLIAFRKRCEEGAAFLSMPADTNRYERAFNYPFGFGEINPCFLVDLPMLLEGLRQRFADQEKISEEYFDHDMLTLSDQGISYKDIKADKIIFCDGINSMHNRFFQSLPFAPNKGELLIAEIPDLQRDVIYKYGLNIVPWQQDLFWIGASHEWKFEDDQPTAAFRERTVAQLKSILKVPFRILDHWAAVRPATLERRPFVGLHPRYPQVGIFNGMGTKGCSLAPYFAAQFADHLLNNQPLFAEADILRFSGILNR